MYPEYYEKIDEDKRKPCALKKASSVDADSSAWMNRIEKNKPSTSHGFLPPLKQGKNPTVLMQTQN